MKGRAPRHRGVLMGRVVEVEADCVVVEMADAHEIAPLKEGDGVVFDAADWRSPGEPEEGGRVYQATARTGWKVGTAIRQWRDSVRSYPGRAIWSGERTIPMWRRRRGHSRRRRRRFEDRWCGFT